MFRGNEGNIRMRLIVTRIVAGCDMVETNHHHGCKLLLTTSEWPVCSRHEGLSAVNESKVLYDRYVKITTTIDCPSRSQCGVYRPQLSESRGRLHGRLAYRGDSLLSPSTGECSMKFGVFFQ